LAGFQLLTESVDFRSCSRLQAIVELLVHNYAIFILGGPMVYRKV